MFDSFNRHFSKRGAENKKVLVTTNVLESVDDDMESVIQPAFNENVPDLDSIQIDDFSILSDMIPATEPKVVSESDDNEIISLAALAEDEDDDDFQDI